MAKETDVTNSKSVSIDKSKSPEVTIEKETNVAPMDKTTDEAPDAEDISDVIMLLNSLDKEVGGKGGISEIPESMRPVMKFMIEKMVFLRDLFEDPQWKAILDDLADQKEDGETPSVEVAVARTMPLDKLMALADSEDYAGAQSELAGNLDNAATIEDEEAAMDVKWTETQAAADEYAAEMGYDEAEKTELLNFAFEQYKIWGDGKLDAQEWYKVDKMRTFDSVTGDLQAQIQAQGAKEVLPDKASIDTTIQADKTPSKTAQQNAPGLGSMSSAGDFGVDVTEVGKRRRGNK